MHYSQAVEDVGEGVAQIAAKIASDPPDEGDKNLI